MSSNPSRSTKSIHHFQVIVREKAKLFRTERPSTGFQLNNISNQLELNPSGDMVMLGQAPSWIVFFQRGPTIATVLNSARRTDDGDLLVTIRGIDLREDGTIYLLALNERDEQVLYSATPIGN